MELPSSYSKCLDTWRSASSHESSNSYTSLPTLSIIILNVTNSSGSKMMDHVTLIGISQTINDITHFFYMLVLLVILISSLGKYLFKSFTLFIGLSLQHWFVQVFCIILDKRPFRYMHYILFQSVPCLFIFLMIYLINRSFLFNIKLKWSVFIMTKAFVFCPINICLLKMAETFSYVFLQKIYGWRFYIHAFERSWISLILVYEVVYGIDPALFVKKYFPFPWI